MLFGNLFKSTKEIEKEKKRQIRGMERNVEKAIERCQDRVKDLEKERAKNWEKAKLALANGQRDEASRLLQLYKSGGVQIARLDRQQTFYQAKLNQVCGATDMSAAAQNLKDMTEALALDPATFEQNLDDVDSVSDDINDMNKTLDKAFAKDQEKMIAAADADKENAVQDDTLMAALESEVAAGILGSKAAGLGDKSASLDDINAGRDRLKAIVDSK